MITAFVLIEARPDAIAELGRALADIDGVREAHSVAGHEVDLVAILAVPDHEAIATKVAFITASTYALESMLELSCLLADDGSTERISDEDLKLGVDAMMRIACRVAVS